MRAVSWPDTAAITLTTSRNRPYPGRLWWGSSAILRGMSPERCKKAYVGTALFGGSAVEIRGGAAMQCPFESDLAVPGPRLLEGVLEGTHVGVTPNETR